MWTAAAAIVLFLLSLVAGTTLSMWDYEAAAYTYGPDATRILDETGFPRATNQPVETYQIIGLENGTSRVTFRIDWAAHNVTVVPAEEGNATLVAHLPPGTAELVRERLADLQASRQPPSGEAFSLFYDIVFRSHITIEGKGWVSVQVWKVSLTHWAAREVTLREYPR